MIDHAEACFREELEITAELFCEQAKSKFDPADEVIFLLGIETFFQLYNFVQGSQTF